MTDSARSAARWISRTSARTGSLSEQRADGELGIADDDRQRVIEVVGDASGETADRVELLRLPQFFLESATIGDVLERPDHSQRACRRRREPGWLECAPSGRRRSDRTTRARYRTAGRRRSRLRVRHAPLRDRPGARRWPLPAFALGPRLRCPENTVHLARPGQAVRAIEFGDPAADMRHFLRLSRNSRCCSSAVSVRTASSRAASSAAVSLAICSSAEGEGGMFAPIRIRSMPLAWS